MYKVIKDSQKIMAYAMPLIFASLLQMGMGIVDNMAVGHYSPRALASMAIAHGLFVFCFLLGLGVLLALRSLISESFAAGESHKIAGLVCQGFWLCIPFSLFTWLSFYYYAPLLRMAGQDESLFHHAGEYLSVLAWSIPAVFAFINLRQLTEGLSDMKVSMWIALGGVLLNIPFDYVFVFGKFGFPAMGAAGAALTTTILHYLMIIALFIVVLKQKKYRELNLFQKQAWLDFESLRSILRIGIPLAGGRLGEICFFLFSMLMMGKLGANELASHQVAINAASLSFMVPMGLSMAMSVWIANEAGKKNLEGVRYYGWLGFALGLVVMIPSALIFWFTPEPIAKMFTSDPKIIAMTCMLLSYAALFQIFDGVQSLGMGILQGINDTKVPFMIIMVIFWLIGAPFCYWTTFVLGHGPKGVWSALILTLAMASVAHMIRFYCLTRSKKNL